VCEQLELSRSPPFAHGCRSNAVALENTYICDFGTIVNCAND
jgi:hypothetical protein